MSRLTTADIVRINREAETQHVDDHRVVLIGGLEVTVHVAATGHLTIAVGTTGVADGDGAGQLQLVLT